MMEKKTYLAPEITVVGVAPHLMTTGFSGKSTTEGDPKVNSEEDLSAGTNRSRRAYDVWEEEEE